MNETEYLYRIRWWRGPIVHYAPSQLYVMIEPIATNKEQAVAAVVLIRSE
jgi:hypothetical protein